MSNVHVACCTDSNQTQLARHLLKTMCTDITNLLLNAVATDHMLSVSDEAQFTAEVCAAVLNDNSLWWGTWTILNDLGPCRL